MNELYIYQHLQMGDHIICNGIIRNIAKNYDKIHLIVKPIYEESIKHMYSDLTNIDYIIKSLEDVDEYVKTLDQGKLLQIGHKYLRQHLNFDYGFYNQVGLNFSKRWTDFYIPRNNKRELELFNKLVPKCHQNNFTFINEDINRDDWRVLKIDFNKIRKDLCIIKPTRGITNNIFDYMLILEKAKEIHVVESCFMFLIDSMKTTKDIFVHKYARKYTRVDIPSLNRPWKFFI